MSPSEFGFRHHRALERLVLFNLRLTCRSGLHIGAGKSADLAGSDLPILRDGSGRPLIPGSSLRGVLRAGIESLCLSLGIDEVVQAQDPGEAPAGMPEKLAKSWKGLPPSERLFGRVAEKSGQLSYGSRFQISDLTAEGEVAVELRDGVAISRETRTAEKQGGAKFDLEVVPAGTRFLGHVRLKNPFDYEVGLIAQALWMLDAGMLLLGGKSARGLGWVQVEVTTPRDLSAQKILDRQMGEGTAGFGAVEEKLGTFLDRLRELADSAAAAS